MSATEETGPDTCNLILQLSKRAVMPREAAPSINERAFVLQALRENIRIDGRALDAFRGLELSFGDEFGIANVKLGKTRYDITPQLSRIHS